MHRFIQHISKTFTGTSDVQTYSNFKLDNFYISKQNNKQWA